MKKQKPQSDLTDLFDKIKVLDQESLILLYDKVEESFLKYANEGVVSYNYDGLRMQFLSREPNPFTLSQVEAVRPWRALSKTRQAEFTRAWTKAMRFMSKIGLGNAEKNGILVKLLVVQSSLFNDGLKFDTIVESLLKIDSLFEDQFPGYIGSGGVAVLREVMK